MSQSPVAMVDLARTPHPLVQSPSSQLPGSVAALVEIPFTTSMLLACLAVGDEKGSILSAMYGQALKTRDVSFHEFQGELARLSGEVLVQRVKEFLETTQGKDRRDEFFLLTEWILDPETKETLRIALSEYTDRFAPATSLHERLAWTAGKIWKIQRSTVLEHYDADFRKAMSRIERELGLEEEIFPLLGAYSDEKRRLLLLAKDLPAMFERLQKRFPKEVFSGLYTGRRSDVLLLEIVISPGIDAGNLTLAEFDRRLDVLSTTAEMLARPREGKEVPGYGLTIETPDDLRALALAVGDPDSELVRELLDRSETKELYRAVLTAKPKLAGKSTMADFFSDDGFFFAVATPLADFGGRHKDNLLTRLETIESFLRPFGSTVEAIGGVQDFVGEMSFEFGKSREIVRDGYPLIRGLAEDDGFTAFIRRCYEGEDSFPELKGMTQPRMIHQLTEAYKRENEFWAVNRELRRLGFTLTLPCFEKIDPVLLAEFSRLIEKFPKVRFIVTDRTPAEGGTWINLIPKGQDLSTAVLERTCAALKQPFAEPLYANLVERWGIRKLAGRDFIGLLEEERGSSKRKLCRELFVEEGARIGELLDELSLRSAPHLKEETLATAMDAVPKIVYFYPTLEERLKELTEYVSVLFPPEKRPQENDVTPLEALTFLAMAPGLRDIAGFKEVMKTLQASPFDLSEQESSMIAAEYGPERLKRLTTAVFRSQFQEKYRKQERWRYGDEELQELRKEIVYDLLEGEED